MEHKKTLTIKKSDDNKKTASKNQKNKKDAMLEFINDPTFEKYLKEVDFPTKQGLEAYSIMEKDGNKETAKKLWLEHLSVNVALELDHSPMAFLNNYMNATFGWSNDKTIGELNVEIIENERKIIENE